MTKLFRYRAFGLAGRIEHGSIRAVSQPDALRLLHDKGLQPFAAEETSDAPGDMRPSLFAFTPGRLRESEKAQFMRDLATLLTSDIGVDQALRILLASTSGARAKAIAARLVDAVVAGKPLSAALSSAQTGFRADEIAIIRAGEQAGALAVVVDQLAGMLSRRLDLRQRLVSALIYPVLLIFMSIGAIFFVLSVLVPNIMPLFEGSGAEIPATIAILIAAGDLIETRWPVLLAAGLALILSMRTAWKKPALRRLTEHMLLRVPFVGALLRKSALAAIARTLATLLQSGVHLQQSLSAAAAVAGNEAARSEIHGAGEAVMQGRRLSAALSNSLFFGPAERRLLALGEETNRLSEMLLHIAGEAETSLAQGLERAMTVLTPLLTLTLGLTIGGLIMSVMQAILSINEIATQ
ncbi:type II secretion system inner membrane protein GspF [soil metagenome]